MVSIASLTVSASGSLDESTGLGEVRLVGDDDRDGQVDPGEAVLAAAPGPAFTVDDGSVTLSLARPLTLGPGSTLQVLVTADATAVGTAGLARSGQTLVMSVPAGGVVARLVVLGNNPYRVDELITIASPHLGTVRAAQGLDIVDSKPFFCPGPGIDFVKSVVGGGHYDYLKYSRGVLLDLLPAESGNLLFWLNRQSHPDS